MTKKTTYLIGILLTILLGTYFYISCCSTCGTSVKDETTNEVTPTPSETKPTSTSYPFSFNDGDYAYETNDNFNFNMSSSSILLPLSEKVEKGISGLKDYITTNTGKVLNITGYYKGDEANKSAYPNLGIARANAVKNYLVEKGIASSTLNISGKLNDDMVSGDDNVYLGPVTYSISGETADLAEELKALYDKVKDDPLVLNFNTGEASINLTTEQRQKIADISRYLDKVDGAKCSATGHTDSQGQRATNIRLGLERADFAKSYLISNGISDAKIVTSSKGPDVPIASNTTEEGRSQNRRTVVTLN
ncbi:OmpA family protein [Cellulophaga sp. HaHaR_3_176]|uniref:OmpA family protein n=1 Tax=Cellulophaga sp. HaHaR_3_176 TaxID=1942464 RepID=UPI001C1F5187|nr:OmpA family protein [Cellulophaga sp. HaHaR_3_176]QWX83422.1 OmpA family protein [Cellulophaga sp. HaHaR_3_176]